METMPDTTPLPTHVDPLEGTRLRALNAEAMLIDARWAALGKERDAAVQKANAAGEALRKKYSLGPQDTFDNESFLITRAPQK